MVSNGCMYKCKEVVHLAMAGEGKTCWPAPTPVGLGHSSIISGPSWMCTGVVWGGECISDTI